MAGKCEAAPKPGVCQSQPCYNNGKCVVQGAAKHRRHAQASEGAAFTCECVLGFSGAHCETAPAPGEW